MTATALTPIAAEFAAGRVTADESLARQTATRYADGDGDGATAVEAAFLRDGVGVVDTGWRDLLAVRGSDAVSFLHRMLTQDLQSLQPGRARRSALLVRKGQLVAEMTAVRPPAGAADAAGSEPGLWFDVGSGRGAALQAGLDPFVIVEDVVFQSLDGTHTSLWLVGPRVAALLQAVGLPAPAANEVAAAQWQGMPLQVLGQPLGELPGARIMTTHAAAAELWRDLTARATEFNGGAAGFAAFETVRIEQGVGRFGHEWTDAVMPKEAGLDECISYTKGCFIGQEPTARLHFRGQPARRLVRLQIPGPADMPLPAPGAALLDAGGREAGSVTSAARSAGAGAIVALGFVKRAALGEPDHLLHLESPDGPAVTINGIAGADTPA